MALQQQPDGYAQAKKEMLEYWHESETIIPFEDFAFVWPESPPSQIDPIPSDVREAIPPFSLSLDEIFNLPDEEATCLIDTLSIRDHEDVLNTRKSEPLELEFLPPRARNGPDHFRKYGPTSITRAAISIPRENMKGEDGMDIPRDKSDVVIAFEKDAKIKVTQEDADYLRSMISRINVEKSVDIILPRVLHTWNQLKCSLNRWTGRCLLH